MPFWMSAFSCPLFQGEIKQDSVIPETVDYMESVLTHGCNFGIAMKTFVKGLLTFTTDLRALRHSDRYYIRSDSLVIIRRCQNIIIY